MLDFYTSLPRAVMWNGSAESAVLLHPSNASTSAALAIDDAMQGGYVQFGPLVPIQHRAVIWFGTADDFTLVHPADKDMSRITAMDNGVQAGTVWLGDQTRAAMWQGTAESYVDLHALLDDGATSSYATGVQVLDDGTIDVVGRASYVGEVGTRALLWRSTSNLTPADLNCDGVVDVFDQLIIIGQWGECDDPAPGNCPADITGPDDEPDGIVDIFDLLKVIKNWG